MTISGDEPPRGMQAVWNPDQYNKFKLERAQPLLDLAGLIRKRPDMRVVDLGCGTGELTLLLSDLLPNASIGGLDSSPEMLAQAEPRANERVGFRLADINDLTDFSDYDLVFSNAAFQWVPDNEGLVRRIVDTLRPGAQVAVQLPQNERHPSHRIAMELAQEQPFRDLLGGFVRRTEALLMERYAELLHAGGCSEQVCIEKVYGHVLGCTEDVVEWVKGTSLSAYLSRLDAEGSAAFLAEYTRRLLAEVGDQRPYFYPFRRLLFWGIKAEA